MSFPPIPTARARCEARRVSARRRLPRRGLGSWLISVAILANVAAHAGSAQQPPSSGLTAFFPLHVGDLWTYELADGASWARTVSSQEPRPDGRVAYRIDESSQDYRLLQMQEEGLSLVSLHFAGGVDIEYEQPVLLVPVDLRVGATHRVESNYAVVERGAPSHRGKQIFEVERLADRSVQTPAGTFENCLVLRIRSRRDSEAGAVAESTHRETRAPGVGLVQIERESAASSQAPWRASLDGASVRGRLLPP